MLFQLFPYSGVSGNQWKSLSNSITCIYCIYIYNIDIIYIIIWYPVKIMCSEKNRTDVRKSLLQVFLF